MRDTRKLPMLFFPPHCGVLEGVYRQWAIGKLRDFHYTHTVPSGKSLYVKFEEAIVVWSIPANQHISKFLFGEKLNVWELSRLWAPNGHRRNLLSGAIAFALMVLKAEDRSLDCVVSYADPNVGHEGTVYRAASWIYDGRSSEQRAYRGFDGQIIARRAFHSGSKSMTKDEIESSGFREIKLPGKHRFIKLISRRAKSLWKKRKAAAEKPCTPNLDESNE